MNNVCPNNKDDYGQKKKRDLLKIGPFIYTIAELMQETKLHKEAESPIQDLKSKIGNNHYYKKSI